MSESSSLSPTEGKLEQHLSLSAEESTHSDSGDEVEDKTEDIESIYLRDVITHGHGHAFYSHSKSSGSCGHDQSTPCFYESADDYCGCETVLTYIEHATRRIEIARRIPELQQVVSKCGEGDPDQIYNGTLKFKRGDGPIWAFHFEAVFYIRSLAINTSKHPGLTLDKYLQLEGENEVALAGYPDQLLRLSEEFLLFLFRVIRPIVITEGWMHSYFFMGLSYYIQSYLNERWRRGLLRDGQVQLVVAVVEATMKEVQGLISEAAETNQSTSKREICLAFESSSSLLRKFLFILRSERLENLLLRYLHEDTTVDLKLWRSIRAMSAEYYLLQKTVIVDTHSRPVTESDLQLLTWEKLYSRPPLVL
ncbi:hypothetical protein BJ508DRAFT_378120 [Ascobolus immersus RN42]|uniref:Uncharacterized protein n=1 Tax=Ascobolus immersus RN42 TaxID=1160509 RepID=A0A3N4I3N0_ASCIM|nr:hypothetical protein BJ508DRAFT_378120 [Ascobolus immersus RN42]